MPRLRHGLPAAAALIFAACAPDTARDVPRHTVADFYRNNEFYGASFSPDGRRLLVTSNLSGVLNAYVIPVEGGDPEPLTQSTTDAVFAVSFFRNDDRILYSSDQGGNELAHIYVRAPDGSVRDLTPGERHTASFVGWSGDDRSFWLTTNERDQRFFDYYEYRTDGYARTMVYRNTPGFGPGPVARHGWHIALTRSNTTSDQDIFLYDRRTGSTTHLTPHEGAIAFTPQDFTPDGTALLFTSDEGREFAALWRYDIASGAKTALLSPAWDVVGAGYSRSGRYLTVWINEEARIVSRVYDAATMAEVPMSGLPTGLVRGLTFSRDDSVVAFYNTDGSTPDDLWAGRVGQPPVRLTNALSAAIRREDLVAPTHVRFLSYDSLQVPGLLYQPHQASRRHPAPAVVRVHGGPGGQAQVGYSALVQAMVNAGYVVFDINNRGSSGYGKTFYRMDDRRHGEADLGDVVASKRMLAATGYVDSTRIGILGGSYGGFMVLAALTLQPRAFSVGVDFFGVSNWLRTLTSIPPYWESFRRAFYDELGDPATDSARLRRISPLFNADSIRVPLLVEQGANDPRVLQVESDEIVAAARRNGVPVEYIVFPDEGHGFVKKANEIRGYAAAIAFLDQHLRGAAR